MSRGRLPSGAGSYSEQTGEQTRLPGPRPCAYHAALEAQIAGLREDVRGLTGHVMDVLSLVAGDRPSTAELIRATRPRSISPARKARDTVAAWAVTVAVALGLGIAIGVARSCGYPVAVPAAQGAVLDAGVSDR